MPNRRPRAAQSLFQLDRAQYLNRITNGQDIGMSFTPASELISALRVCMGALLKLERCAQEILHR
jgi:hypothetical protein